MAAGASPRRAVAAGLEGEGRVSRPDPAPGADPDPVPRDGLALDEGAVRRAEVADDDAIAVDLEREVLAGEGLVLRAQARRVTPSDDMAAAGEVERPAGVGAGRRRDAQGRSPRCRARGGGWASEDH